MRDQTQLTLVGTGEIVDDNYIPDRGTAISVRQLEAIEHQMAAVIPAADNVKLLDHWRRKARALEEYLRAKNMQGPMLSTQRRCEARLGQMLPPEQGKRTDLELPHHDEEVLHDQTLNDFRILAYCLSGECPLEFEEWRRSRRALVALVRQRMGLLPELEPLPAGIFRCIVADPPWQMDTGPDTWGTTGESGHDDLAYTQMSIERIKEMPVEQSAADDAHLYLWTVNKYIEPTYEIARAWGFKPSVLLVWAKDPHGVGLGDKFRLTTEFILYARRGKLEELQICPTTWFNWPRSIHSRKPKEFFDLVESMTPAPYKAKDRLELFAREKRKGWTVWGNEV